jgi:hypothetical protein
MIETLHVNNYNIEELLYDYDENDTREQEQQKEKKLFLFLEGDYFENVQEEVEGMDINANTKLLWENSNLWHEHRANGPLIVETINSSPIFKTFLEEWSEENRGVIILSNYSLEQVTQHLQSLIFVTEPDNTLTRLRLYEPRKLRGLLNAMQEPNSLSDMMGCIETFVWQENCGLEEEWLHTNNPNPHAPRYNIYDENWFVFTEEQNVILFLNEEEYFCKKLSYKLEDLFRIPVEQEQRYEQIKLLSKEAKEQNFFPYADREKYMRLRLEFGDFRDDEEIEKILKKEGYAMGGKLVYMKKYLRGDV